MTTNTTQTVTWKLPTQIISIPNGRVPTFLWPGPHLGIATFFCWEFNLLWSLAKSFFGADRSKIPPVRVHRNAVFFFLSVSPFVSFSFLCLPINKAVLTSPWLQHLRQSRWSGCSRVTRTRGLSPETEELGKFRGSY